MRIPAASLTVLCLFASAWTGTAGVPLFLMVKNMPPSRSTSVNGGSGGRGEIKTPSTEDRLGFIDKLSDALPMGRRLGRYRLSPYRRPLLPHPLTQPTTSEAERTGARWMWMGDGKPHLSAPEGTGAPFTVVELETEGLTSQVHLPCRFSPENSPHYQRARRYADLMVVGAIIGFFAILIVTELLFPLCDRYACDLPPRRLTCYGLG